MFTTVVNKNKERYDILIQNGTKWGNPFYDDPKLSREQKVKKFEDYFYDAINRGVIKREDLKILYGKKLGCSCKPLACHGDIIANYVNEEFSPLAKFFTKGIINE